MRSEKFLSAVVQEAGKRNFVINHADTVIILEKPKLGPYKKKMAARIAKILALPADAVSVKAKTLEGLGPEGQGLAVTCEAIVTLRKA